MKRTMKGAALLGPVPSVMVSCGTMDGKKNIITVGWTGMLCTTPPKTYISVRPTRHSHNMIMRTGEFVLNLTPASLVYAADYCGTYTGAKVDKFAECGLTPEAATELSAPMIAECPVSLECRVTQVINLGSHDMFIADIVAVNAEETLFDRTGKLHLGDADLTAFLHGAYYSLGKKLGTIGCCTKRKNTQQEQNKPARQERKETEKRPAALKNHYTAPSHSKNKGGEKASVRRRGKR